MGVLTQTRGFAVTKEDAERLRDHGLPDKAIYQAGRGAESLEECLASFRGRVGKLVIARDLRAFGASKRDVAAAMANLEKAKIRVVDILHPGDVTVAEMMQRAGTAISGGRFRDRRAAKRMGRAGGLGRGMGCKNLREELVPTWLLDRIVDEREIPWHIKVALVAPHFSQSTLRRHYGSNPVVKR